MLVFTTLQAAWVAYLVYCSMKKKLRILAAGDIHGDSRLANQLAERAVKEKVTISEKPIHLIIYQLNKDQKIQFTQKDGWKIRI